MVPLLRRAGRLRAFSLIELLVVVGIIVLLMSITFPALKRSLRQARSTVCMHNLRAIDQMMQMYRFESKGFLPHMPEADSEDDTESKPWFDALVPRYLTDLSVLICPDDPYKTLLERASRANPHPDWSDASSYGMNDFILGSPSSYLANLDRHPPRRPLDTLILADMGPDEGSPAEDGLRPLLELDRPHGRLSWGDGFDCGAPQPPRPWLTRRHGKTINVLTLGGEVRSVRTAELMNRTIEPYYTRCAAGDCTFCLELEAAHYSFAHARTYWWTGPIPAP